MLDSCTMRAAGEEVGFNLTGHVYSSPLTFGLSEMCNESPSREEGAVGASPSTQLLPGPPSPAALCSACVQQTPTLQTQGRNFSRNKQTDAKPQKYSALICKLAKRDPERGTRAGEIRAVGCRAREDGDRDRCAGQSLTPTCSSALPSTAALCISASATQPNTHCLTALGSAQWTVGSREQQSYAEHQACR